MGPGPGVRPTHASPARALRAGPRRSSPCSPRRSRCTPSRTRPLGAFLSGGLDSSAIVALMAERSRYPVETFCVGYGPEGRSYEERPVARRVAELAQPTANFELDIDLLGDLETLVRGFDEPFGSWAALLSHRLSRFTRQHVTVALAGDGGDEVSAVIRATAACCSRRACPMRQVWSSPAKSSPAPASRPPPAACVAGPASSSRAASYRRPSATRPGSPTPRPPRATGCTPRALARPCTRPVASPRSWRPSPSLALGTWSKGQATPTCAASCPRTCCAARTG